MGEPTGWRTVPRGNGKPVVALNGFGLRVPRMGSEDNRDSRHLTAAQVTTIVRGRCHYRDGLVRGRTSTRTGA